MFRDFLQTQPTASLELPGLGGDNRGLPPGPSGLLLNTTSEYAPGKVDDDSGCFRTRRENSTCHLFQVAASCFTLSDGTLLGSPRSHVGLADHRRRRCYVRPKSGPANPVPNPRDNTTMLRSSLLDPTQHSVACIMSLRGVVRGLVMRVRVRVEGLGSGVEGRELGALLSSDAGHVMMHPIVWSLQSGVWGLG